jgi:hypothetical protein
MLVFERSEHIVRNIGTIVLNEKMKNEKNEEMFEKMKMKRQGKLIVGKRFDNQLIRLFINDWLRIVNDKNKFKNCLNYRINKTKEWVFLQGILG